MVLSINTNISSIKMHNSLMTVSNGIKTSIERMSSGYKINRAADDAAGLSISESLTSKKRGNDQASRNAQDGISMLQIAEGSLSNIHDLLQRGRDLSVQASNGTNGQEEKEAIKAEIGQIIQGIEKISKSTKFNSISLLDGSIGSNLTDLQSSIINSLKSGWLDDAQNKISTHYGLTPSNFDMELFFHDNIDGALAYVSYSKYGDGTLAGLSLHIDESDFAPNTGTSGDNAISSGATGMYNDMILAHEMNHAVIADQIKVNVPTWFNEGTSELLVGRDNQLHYVTNNSNEADVLALVEEAAQLVEDENWNGTGAYFNYSVGYFATKFLANKNGNTLVDVFDALETGQSFDAALGTTPVGNKAGLAAAIRAEGKDYYDSLFLTDADTGSIQGSDHGGGSVTAENVIQAIGQNDNPTNFNIIFPGKNDPLKLQIGANTGDTIDVEGMNASSLALGISSVDVRLDACDGIQKFDNAIKQVSTQRSNIGSIQNKLDSIISSLDVRSQNLSATLSTIRDTDIAKESSNLVKSNILQQATTTLMAQANQSSSLVLALLGR